MKPGDLCSLIGTWGFGPVYLVIKTNANSVGGVEVLRQDGRIVIIGRRFLDVISS